LEPATSQLKDGVRRGLPLAEPFAMTALSQDPQEQLLCARTYREHDVTRSAPVWHGERYRHGRIRVAYLSSDFREHAVAYCIAELIELHDRAKFEIIGASLGVDDGGPTRARLVRAFDRFIDVRPLSDPQAAQRLREAEVDIVIDLMGYTRGGKPGILAHRPAPVQAGYLGFPGTVGAEFLDYIIADGYVLPEADEAFFSEKVVRLPDSYQVNDRRRDIAARVYARTEVGLPEHGFVFASFNNSHKISPGLFDVWMRLLESVPGSVLWLFADNEAAERNLRKEARARGVAAERIVFASRVPASEYRARCRLADLCLDTLPYNGHGTTGDMLWCGVPVLTCEGTAFPGRVGGSLLRAVGLPELIAADPGQYEAKALELAGDRPRLAALRAKLERNRHSAPLFDTDRFRLHIESAYTTMWEIAHRGEAPRSFSVPA
jgi:predicted O-linked N-acetylglucosamine transferase (SPINDLY family)